ncbi:MAG: cytochrome c biogenesis protein ResB [Kiritimatiellia bacterium]
MRLMSSLQLTVAGLFLLMVLTIWGTLYQADHGIYQAQERFYLSWGFLGGGWFPMPGGQLVMMILFLNLTASFIVITGAGHLTLRYVLTHGGLALMLAAGAVTFLFGERSKLMLFEGEATNLSGSGQEWELSVWRSGEPETARTIQAVDLAALRPGMPVSFPHFGLELRVETVHAHSRVGKGSTSGSAPLSADGAVSLEGLPTETDAGNNRPGLLASTSFSGRSERVLLHGNDTRPVELAGTDGNISLRLRRKSMVLPAVIRLIDFQREMHPGTSMARSFSSRVSIQDGDLEREVTISMNKPLRYRGHTFYQSSYKEFADGRQATILAVVKNHGRVMPYVATFMTFIGMAIHYTGRLAYRLRRQTGGGRGRS